MPFYGKLFPSPKSILEPDNLLIVVNKTNDILLNKGGTFLVNKGGSFLTPRVKRWIEYGINRFLGSSVYSKETNITISGFACTFGTIETIRSAVSAVKAPNTAARLFYTASAVCRGTQCALNGVAFYYDKNGISHTTVALYGFSRVLNVLAYGCQYGGDALNPYAVKALKKSDIVNLLFQGKSDLSPRTASHVLDVLKNDNFPFSPETALSLCDKGFNNLCLNKEVPLNPEEMARCMNVVMYNFCKDVIKK